MAITVSFDPAKREVTLNARGLDFARASELFEGRVVNAVDDRFDYGEVRHLTYGWLDDQAVAIVWTERNDDRRVISMRRMHRWEIEHVGLD